MVLPVLEVFAFCSTHGIQSGKAGWSGLAADKERIVSWVRERDAPLEVKFLPAFATGFLCCKGHHLEQHGHCGCVLYLLGVLLDAHKAELQNS